MLDTKWSRTFNMDDVYTRSAFLLVFLLFVDAGQLLADAGEGRLRKRDFSGISKSRYHHEPRLRRGRSSRAPDDQYFSYKEKGLYKHSANNHVIAQTGSAVIFHCDIGIHVYHINTTVLWIRMYNNSFVILTKDTKILTEDKRFKASNITDFKDWTLHIRYTQSADEGLYQCQVCPNSTTITNYTLKLEEAKAKILGGPVKSVKKIGYPLRLSCILLNSIQAPAYIFWYHDDRMINYDLGDGATVRQGRQGSELIFPRANVSHVGNYSCVPSNAVQDSVFVKFGEIPNTENGRKNGGKRFHPREHVVNMLALLSTFHLRR